MAKKRRIYINMKGHYGVETVDEADSMKEARSLLSSYNLLRGNYYYISRRSDIAWREKE